jgi:hypothetical protein
MLPFLFASSIPVEAGQRQVSAQRKRRRALAPRRGLCAECKGRAHPAPECAPILLRVFVHFLVTKQQPEHQK